MRHAHALTNQRDHRTIIFDDRRAGIPAATIIGVSGRLN
jgi:hypothetical protein